MLFFVYIKLMQNFVFSIVLFKDLDIFQNLILLIVEV